MFAIPLADGTNLLGQVIAHEPSALNSVGCALFDQRFSDATAPSPDLARLFSVILVTRDLLDSGAWRVVSSGPVGVAWERIPYERFRSAGFVGAKIQGSRNVVAFANAFCGLAPWDDWHDPDYLDQFLLAKDKKPERLIYRKRP
jgi:hypothetical protein